MQIIQKNKTEQAIIYINAYATWEGLYSKRKEQLRKDVFRCFFLISDQMWWKTANSKYWWVTETNYTYVILSACKLHIKEMLVYMTCNTDQIISWSLNQQLLILYNDKINGSSLKTELGMLQTQNLVGINLNIKYLSNPPGKFMWIFS